MYKVGQKSMVVSIEQNCLDEKMVILSIGEQFKYIIPGFKVLAVNV